MAGYGYVFCGADPYPPPTVSPGEDPFWLEDDAELVDEEA